jgi:hypothetical protein
VARALVDRSIVVLLDAGSVERTRGACGEDVRVTDGMDPNVSIAHGITVHHQVRASVCGGGDDGGGAVLSNDRH